MEDYNKIEISKVLFIIWSIIGVINFFLLIIPICYYFILKNCKYYYNDEKLIVEKGTFNKTQQIVPLYRIVNVTANENILNFGTIYIRDKEQCILLKYVKSPKSEMLRLSEKWEKAKKNNIRNEII